MVKVERRDGRERNKRRVSVMERPLMEMVKGQISGVTSSIIAIIILII